MRRLFLFLYLVLFSALATGEEPLASSSLASTEGIASSLVNGCVCAISGEYVDTAVDLFVPGPTPLLLQRNYCSARSFLDYNIGRWVLSEPSKLIFDYSLLDKKTKELNAVTTTAHGARAKYHRKVKKEEEGEVKVKLKFGNNKGYTNCGAGFICGQTNLRNNQLFIDLTKRKKVKETTAELVAGNGDKRTFIFSSLSGLVHLICNEDESCQKTRKTFTYKDKTDLVRIQNKNSAGNLEFGAFQFFCLDKKKDGLKVTSSLGEQVLYSFKGHKYKIREGEKTTEIEEYYIEDVDSPYKPQEHYEYVKAKKTDHYLLLSEKRSHGRILQEIQYYSKGKNLVGDKIVELEHSSDSQVDRVMVLKAPVGADATRVTTHTFFYTVNKDKYDEIIDGSTDVFDAYNNKTSYHYDDQQRLSALKKYIGSNTLYSEESYVWGSSKPLEGNLLGTYLKDALGQIKKGKAFYYDNKGNITELLEYGKVQGDIHNAIVFNNKYPPENGAEYYRRSFEYDDKHRVTKEKETNGKTTAFKYLDESNLPVQKEISDSKGVVCRERYGYDANFFLITKIVDQGEGTPQKITRYTPRMKIPYGVPECIEEKYLLNGKEKLLHAVNNHYTKEGYLEAQEHFDSNNVSRYVLRWTYNKHGKVTKETDALGQVITRTYDDYDNLTEEIGPSKATVRYEYDHSNRLTKATYTHDDGKVLSCSYRYDYLGNRIMTQDIHGNQTLSQYDSFGHVTKVTYPAVHDGQGQVVQPTEEFKYDILGHLTQKTDKRGFTTYYEHNVHGKPLSISYPDGTSEQFFYKSDGTLLKSVHKDLSYTLYKHDCFGHLLKKEEFSQQGECLSTHEYEFDYFHLLSETDEEGLCTSYQYDAAGRLLAKIKGDQKTGYEYDTLNRVSKEIEWITPSEARVTAYNYDLLNRVIEERVETLSGQILSSTQYAYNVFGQKILTKTGDSIEQTLYNSRQEPIKIIDAEGNETKIAYQFDYRNSLGQGVTRITTTDALGNTLVQEKDALGRIVAESGYNSRQQLLARKKSYFNPEGDLEMVQYDRIASEKTLSSIKHIWSYDPARKLTAITEAIGTSEQRSRRYEYNAFGQKTALIKPDGVKIAYAYDAKGRLATVQTSDKTLHYSFEYNRRDQVVKCADLNDHHETLRCYDAFGRLKQETLGNGLTISFSYDALDRKTELTLPDGSSIQYAYDPLFLREVSRVSGAKSLYTHYYEKYDLAGNVLKSRLPLQAGTLEYTYDKLHRERSIKHPAWTEEIHSFDKLGNLLHLKVQDDLGEVEARYSYDDLNQLTAENGHEEHKYQYDSLHNRIQKDMSDCPISPLNHLLAQEGIEYKYDPNGNLIEKNERGEVTYYTYDAWNRLKRSRQGNRETHYTYDAFHRRLSKNQESYLFDGQDEIAGYQQGQLQALRLLGLAKEAEIGGAIALEIKGKVLIPLHDHTGSVVTLLNPDGTVNKAYRYTAFGIELTSLDDNPWRFCSKHFDPETGFTYFGRRYYDAEVGRWTTPDPTDYEDGPNLHAYVHNKPLTHLDAYGLFSFSSTINGIGNGLFNLFSQVSSLLGNMLYNIGHHLMPCPIAKDIFQFPGHLLCGGNPSNYVMSYREQHSYYQLAYEGSEPGNSNMVMMNGMCTDWNEALRRAYNAHKSAGGKKDTYVCYNATHGFVSDLFECVLQGLGIPVHATHVAKKCLVEATGNLGENGTTYVNAHSQAGLTLNDASRSLSKSTRSRIDAFTVASPVAIPEGMFKHYKKCGSQ